jgi:hypothetical protein
MPQADKQDVPLHKPETLEGQTLEPKQSEDLDEALRLAFDYRGDVTVFFKDGSEVFGFLSNHDKASDRIEIFVAEGRSSEMKEFKASEVIKIFFSGADPAFGKSWEDWMAKSEALRVAEAKRLQAEAERLGHL